MKIAFREKRVLTLARQLVEHSASVLEHFATFHMVIPRFRDSSNFDIIISHTTLEMINYYYKLNLKNRNITVAYYNVSVNSP